MCYVLLTLFGLNLRQPPPPTPRSSGMYILYQCVSGPENFFKHLKNLPNGYYQNTKSIIPEMSPNA